MAPSKPSSDCSTSRVAPVRGSGGESACRSEPRAPTVLRVQPFLVAAASGLADPSPEQVRAVNALDAELWRESDPDEVDFAPAVTETRLRETWHGFQHLRWIASPTDAPGAVVGMVKVDVPVSGENDHLVEVTLGVSPRWRRRGVGSALLADVVRDARWRGRTVLGFSTTDRVPAGAAFAVRLGAEARIEERESECHLARVDRDMVRRWASPPREVTDTYELWRSVGPYPPEAYEAIAGAQNIMNTAPRDDLDRNDIRFTADHVAHREATRDFELSTRWTHFVRHKPTGSLVGYTRVYFWRDWPGMVEQGDTAVHPEHRGHGLGKWLKGSMVDEIHRERPDADRIRTSNAYTNGPMLAINTALGFRVTRTITGWQVPLDRAAAALGLP